MTCFQENVLLGCVFLTVGLILEMLIDIWRGGR